MSIDEATIPDLTVSNLLTVSGNATFDESVGIGAAFDPEYAFSVTGNSKFSGDVTFADGDVRIENGSLFLDSGLLNGDGAGLANLNASNVSHGTLDNARLDADVVVANSLTVATTGLYATETNVGVGTLSPGANLHVVGNAKFTTDLEVGSNVFVVDSTNAFVGINTATPLFPLDVRGSEASGIEDAYAYLSYSGENGILTGSALNNTAPVSIRSEFRVTASEFNALSDMRIKTDITTLPTSDLLELVKSAMIKEYTYLDKAKYGNHKRIGFVAQDLQKILPQAVNTSEDFRPDVYKKARRVEDVDDVFSCPGHGLTLGEKYTVRVVLPSDAYATSICVAIDEDTISLPCVPDDITEVFVFGTLGELLSIDQDQMSAAAVGAISEIVGRMESMEARLAALEAKM